MSVHTTYSATKILYHADKINDLKNNRRTAPVYVRVKPTNICNQRCYYCVYADDYVFNTRKVNRKESIPWEKMQEIIKDFQDIGVKAVTFSGGGEPLMYHSIIPTLKLVKEFGIDYSIITNAQELKGEKADLLTDAKWVRVSMDATNAESYQKIRKVSTYDDVIKNVENFAKKKNLSCELGINFVVTVDSYQDIYAFCEKMKYIGVNNIKFSPLAVKSNSAEYHAPIRNSVEEQLARAKEKLISENFYIVDKYTDDLTLKEDFQKSYNRCWMKEVFTVIAADQKVYFCHQKAYQPEGLIGDISECSFKDLWFSDRTTELFKRHDACKECNFRCAFEERNMILNEVLGQDLNHVNFI